MDARTYVGGVDGYITGSQAGTATKGAHWPDARLVQVAQHGDTQAFGVLVDRYHRQVYGIVCRVCGRRDAEDLTQEVFIRALRALREFKYQGEAGFRTWLFRIAVNTSINELRKRKRRSKISGPSLNQTVGSDDREMWQLMPADAETPQRVAERREQQRAVHRVLQTLPEKHRIALTLVDLQGLQYREAADAIGCPLGTLKSRLARARETFARRFRSHMRGSLTT